MQTYENSALSKSKREMIAREKNIERGKGREEAGYIKVQREALLAYDTGKSLNRVRSNETALADGRDGENDSLTLKTNVPDASDNTRVSRADADNLHRPPFVNRKVW